MTEPTNDLEAAAWTYRNDAGDEELILDCNGEYARKLLESGYTETPLYAHPPAKPDAPAEQTDDAGALVEQLWQSDAASALTNRAARRIEELEAALRDDQGQG